MREILFRGKRIDNGEWVEGQYAYLLNPRTEDGEPIKHMILDGTPFGTEVNPSTIGQYTGLTDKNGKRIFEGDIIEFDYDISAVKMSDGCWGLDDGVTLLYDLQNVKVIGNIHDNPELLEGD